MTVMPAGVEAMVMNPPFTKAAAFIRHALALGVPKVIVLLRLAWLGSTETRKDLLEGGHLARIYVFSKRLPKMHRFGWPGPWTSADEEHCLAGVGCPAQRPADAALALSGGGMSRGPGSIERVIEDRPDGATCWQQSPVRIIQIAAVARRKASRPLARPASIAAGPRLQSGMRILP